MGKKGANRVRVKQVNPTMPKNPLANLTQGMEEIKLPPRPDKTLLFPWPPHDLRVRRDLATFKTIYPNYIDADKTKGRGSNGGRRIAKADATSRPSVYEMSEALQSLNLRHVVEPHRGYSRDMESRWYNPGRIRVDLNKRVVDLTGDEELDMAWTKMGLMKEIAKRVPTCPSRLRRIEEEKVKKKKEEEEARLAKAKAATSGGSGGGGGGGGGGSGGGGSRKKKGKKRR